MDFSKFTCDELKNFMKEAAKTLEKKDEQMDGAYDKAYNAIVKAVKEYMHTTGDLFPIAFVSDKDNEYFDCVFDFFPDNENSLIVHYM